MRTDIQVGIFDVIIFLGVFQGLLLSLFFIKNVQSNRKPNLFQGLLLLALSLAIFEEWLNNTGFIVKVLYMTNFTESFNLAFGPLFYFFIYFSLYPDSKKRTWVHFILFLFWTFYMVFQFIQPDEMKYNSYIQTKHPDWEYLSSSYAISDDPLEIRRFINPLMILQLFIYLSAAVYILIKKFRSLNQHIFNTDNELLRILRNTTFHFIILIFLVVIMKIIFGMRSDVGGYIVASYVSFVIYTTTWQIMNRSDFFNNPGSFLSFPVLKYQRSSLSEEKKELILQKIKGEMEKNSFFTNNLASLSGLARQINESSHHVSQVINEKMNRSFFDLLSYYRVELAKKLIKEDMKAKITIEELAELVGYNSKSSFNTAFKKYTSKTPSEFRKSTEE